ncbi:MAG: SLC13 family permease [Alphaproteobacteria bacterium]|nr:SLC13 family permease [Alphaproteobacteria bacterium]
MTPVDPSFQMWATFALIIAALALYTLERLPMELTSLLAIASLLLLFHFFPIFGPSGENLLTPLRILEGFANPALITVLALLVVGQGLLRTGVLDRAARLVFKVSGGGAWRSVTLSLAIVLVVSAFLNNIPVVVIFIPIMQALADRLGRSSSSLMIPLSYAAILGGMTTLIGSSTNLLVASSLIELGLPEFSFFEFTVPGLVLAASGLAYVILIAPRIIPDRSSPAREIMASSGKQYISQIQVTADSKLVAQSSVGGFFPNLKDMTVRLVQRGEHAFVPPFEDLTIRRGDVMIVAATRSALMEAVKEDPGLLNPDLAEVAAGTEGTRGEAQVLAEVMISPASRMIGQNLEQIQFRRRFNAIVVGVQRRSRMIRARMTEIRLEAGDILMLQGRPETIEALRGNPDMILLEWSATDLPSPYHARRALIVFFGTVLLAATGVVPIVTAALAGAAGMIATGCLTVRQAVRAVDSTIVMMIGAALGLGLALEETGGAPYLAHALIAALKGAGPTAILSGFFLLVALLSNILNTKACAVLFTPIGVEIAFGLGMDPLPFAVAVVFAANSSFASPIGYQTNLLVMGPGNYRFVDFAIVGLPLIAIVWVAFTLFAPWYYGI